MKSCLPPFLVLSAGLLASASLCGGDSRIEAEQLLCRQSLAGAVAGPEAPDYRKYAPDRQVDILHLALDVTPDFKRRTVAGQMTLTFKPIAKALDELRLDGVDLTVASVTCSEKIAGHQVTGREVIITFAKPIPPDKETRLTIKYSAEPAKGLYFRTPEMGYPAGEMQVWTQGESDEARHWYPSYDYPNEKFTSEITCRVPEGMTVLSNGRKVSGQKDARTGLLAVRWQQDKPHVNYLLTLVAGYLKKIEDRHRDIPLTFYTPPADINEAPNSFRDTKDIMAFFEKEIGVPYPWAQYGQVVVLDFHWGGMENTSLTTLTDRTLFQADTENIFTSTGLVAHELAHQWFGDLVTCKDWSHIWLNEGFATYYTHLYHAHKYGPDEMRYGLYRTAQSITQRSNDNRAIVSRKYGQPEEQFRQFGYLAYGKGGWVLHMLRSQLGENLYRRCIRTYLERHQFGNVVTESLNAIIEELSGRSYDPFFDQWVYHAHHPELEVSYHWDEKAKLAKVSIKQNQKITDDVPLFRFPLTLRFKSKAGTVDRRVEIKDKEQDFFVALKQAPEIVRADPELTLLATINLKLPNAMLYAQLADTTDAMGRLRAAEELAAKTDGTTVGKLKETLNQDAFYGVRIQASESLRKIHTDAALEALVASTKQADARVRNAVFSDIAGFYHPLAFQTLRSQLDVEKNPAIVATVIRGLGADPQPKVRDTLLRFLKSDSYRQRLAEAAIAAIRRQENPAHAGSLQEELKRRETDFPSTVFASGLDTLAWLARNEPKKDAVRAFLAGYVNHPRDRIQLAAIKALGTLEDPAAIPLLETFAAMAKDRPEQKEAEKAIVSLQSVRKPADNLKDLRREVLDVQKENRRLGKELEELKKKFDASRPEPAKAKP